jgi:hypothetical protein
MISKLLVFIIVAVTIIGLDATCTGNVVVTIQTASIYTTSLEPTTTTTTTIITTTPPYHPCPRSMNTYLQKYFGRKFRCDLGFQANQCATNAGCFGQVNNYCCQQNNACNECVSK